MAAQVWALPKGGGTWCLKVFVQLKEKSSHPLDNSLGEKKPSLVRTSHFVPVISSHQHFPSSPRNKISIIIGDVTVTPERAGMLFLWAPQDSPQVD